MGRAPRCGPNGAGAAALLGSPSALGLAGHDGAGLLEIPAATNGRGLREAGVLPNAGPGLGARRAERRPRRRRRSPQGLADGELTALYLLRRRPAARAARPRELWERALASAQRP